MQFTMWSLTFGRMGRDAGQFSLVGFLMIHLLRSVSILVPFGFFCARLITCSFV